jgi:hypothetical protein
MTAGLEHSSAIRLLGARYGGRSDGHLCSPQDAAFPILLQRDAGVGEEESLIRRWALCL